MTDTSYPTTADTMLNAGWFTNGAIGVRETADGPLTITDAYARALPWSVVSDTAVNGATFEEVPNLRLIRRDDTNEVIGWGSDGYRPIQNAECAELLSDALDGVDHSVAAIGSLRRGARTFIALELAEGGTMNVGGDRIDPYLILSNSFDGSSPLRLLNTARRPACTNMLAMTFRRAQKVVTVRHTRNAGQFMSAVAGAIQGFLTARDEFQEEVQRLIDTTVTARQVDEVFAQFAPITEDMTPAALTRAENRRERVADMYHYDPRVGFTGTAWGLFQTLSTYAQNEGQFRSTATGPRTRDERKVEWALAGGQHEQRAMTLIDRVLIPA